MSDFGEDLLRSVEEAFEIARGATKPARAFTPPPVDVGAIRKRTGLTQARFAARYGFSKGAVRNWEQRRRVPEATARTLLLVLDREPAAVDRALNLG